MKFPLAIILIALLLGTLGCGQRVEIKSCPCSNKAPCCPPAAPVMPPCEEPVPQVELPPATTVYTTWIIDDEKDSAYLEWTDGDGVLRCCRTSLTALLNRQKGVSP